MDAQNQKGAILFWGIMMNELQELIIKSEELLDDLEKDKDVKEQNWWLDQRAQLAEAIDNAKKIYDEEVSLIAEVKRLRWAKWELTNNYAELQTEVKRLREENEQLKSELDGCDDCLKEWAADNSS